MIRKPYPLTDSQTISQTLFGATLCSNAHFSVLIFKQYKSPFHLNQYAAVCMDNIHTSTICMYLTYASTDAIKNNGTCFDIPSTKGLVASPLDIPFLQLHHSKVGEPQLKLWTEEA